MQAMACAGSARKGTRKRASFVVLRWSAVLLRTCKRNESKRKHAEREREKERKREREKERDAGRLRGGESSVTVCIKLNLRHGGVPCDCGRPRLRVVLKVMMIRMQPRPTCTIHLRHLHLSLLLHSLLPPPWPSYTLVHYLNSPFRSPSLSWCINNPSLADRIHEAGWRVNVEKRVTLEAST
jgi:hypothetical protein